MISQMIDSFTVLEAARDGDPAAIESLLALSQPDIRKYARMSCRAQDIDDAVQEALWLMHRRIGALKALSSFAGWLFTIVKRECLRLARRNVGGHRPVDDIIDNAAFSQRSDVELSIDLTRAISSLPEHYRNVLLLRDVEELTVDEIANINNTTRETVKARLHRARLLVREYLRD